MHTHNTHTQYTQTHTDRQRERKRERERERERDRDRETERERQSILFHIYTNTCIQNETAFIWSKLYYACFGLILMRCSLTYILVTPRFT